MDCSTFSAHSREQAEIARPPIQKVSTTGLPHVQEFVSTPRIYKLAARMSTRNRLTANLVRCILF